jgi:dCMP deaminase
MNAIINADPIKRKGSTMYLVGVENNGSFTEADCCSMCKRMIINSGVAIVVFRTATGGIREVNVRDWVDDDDSLTIHEGY